VKDEARTLQAERVEVGLGSSPYILMSTSRNPV
jgi:hypothetical protein